VPVSVPPFGGCTTLGKSLCLLGLSFLICKREVRVLPATGPAWRGEVDMLESEMVGVPQVCKIITAAAGRGNLEPRVCA
jgi:hypothetical protein